MNPIPQTIDAGELLKRLDRLQTDVDFIKHHMCAYLGDGVGLTHLVDETPIYVNTNDFGGPANFINGGRYEEEYISVLASFLTPDSVFLDIGANLGVFSLRLAPFMRHGHAIAFEPNPNIRELFQRSIHLNGLSQRIMVHPCGLSDSAGIMTLSVPDGHTGGASIGQVGEHATGVKVEVRVLDQWMDAKVQPDVVKIDVEGHELNVLKGMVNTLARSPGCVVLFEKLGTRTGIEPGLVGLFSDLGMRVYHVDGTRLNPVSLQAFEELGAYFIAARPARVEGQLDRAFVTMLPRALHVIAASGSASEVFAKEQFAPNTLLFHGPYWFLPRGTYEILVDGDFDQPISLTAAEKFGYAVHGFTVTSDAKRFVMAVDRDLTHFELVGRAVGTSVSFVLRSITVRRLG
jgi:FkbM family methyltransferase